MDALTDLQVVEIFNAAGTTRKLAIRFGVSKLVVSQIKNGRGAYQDVIRDYKHQALMHINKGRFGCDPDYKIFKTIRDKMDAAV